MNPANHESLKLHFQTGIKDFSLSLNKSSDDVNDMTAKIYHLQLLMETIQYCSSLWDSCDSCCVCFESEFDFVAIFGCCRHWICCDCASLLIIKNEDPKILCPQCRDPSGLNGLYVIPKDILLLRKPTPRITIDTVRKRTQYRHGLTAMILDDKCAKQAYDLDYMILTLMCELQKKIHSYYTLRQKNLQETAELRYQLEESGYFIHHLENLIVRHVTGDIFPDVYPEP